MVCPSLSITESLSGKSILVIGGAGFIGKVWLAMMLDYVPQIQKINIILRCKRKKNALIRFEELYENSPAFSHIKRKYGAGLDSLKNINIIEGDITKVNFGLSEDLYQQLLDETDVTLNFAADLRFNAPLDELLQSNTNSTLKMAEFIKRSKKSKLLHVSTCYVAGAADGMVEEVVNIDKCPLGHKFSAREEAKDAMQEAHNARALDATNSELTQLGIARAQKLGWPNVYTYTKALGEIMLTQELPPERLSIFRPSIVESAESYPFPGWNEDFNGTAPLIQMIESRYRILVAKPNNKLDVIPVDYVAKGLSIALSALVSNVHQPVYQCGTSEPNPLTLKAAALHTARFQKINEKKMLKKLFLPRFKTRFVSPRHIMAANNIKKMEKKLSFFLDKLSTRKTVAPLLFPARMQKTLRYIKQQTKLIDAISNIYKPFIYDYNYTFKCDNLLSHQVVEKQFIYSPMDINWTRYWAEIHIPGIKKWCLNYKKK